MFEQYQFNGLLFEFKSDSGEAIGSVNTALGTVIMSTEYDAAKPIFKSRTEMEAYEFTTSDKPSNSFIHAVECDYKQNVMRELYVRGGSVPYGDDIRFYDHGVFQVATYGMQASSVVLGELWVSYDVMFYKPRLPAAAGFTSYDHLRPALGTDGGMGNPVIVANDLGCYLSSQGTSWTINMPYISSAVLVVVVVAGGFNSTTAWSPNLQLTTCSGVPLVSAPGGNTYFLTAGSTINSSAQILLFAILPNAQTSSVTWTMKPAAYLSSVDVFATAYPTNLSEGAPRTPSGIAYKRAMEALATPAPAPTVSSVRDRLAGLQLAPSVIDLVAAALAPSPNLSYEKA
jgi:hypothetical protein